MLLELSRDGMQAHKEFCYAAGWEVPQKGNSQAEERQRGEFSLKACRALTHKQLVAQLREWQRLEWEGQQLSSLQAFHRQDGACSWWRGPATFPG